MSGLTLPARRRRVIDVTPPAPFALRNDPRKAPRLTIVAERQQQRSLLSGLDCLPDQIDLFQVDGEVG